MTNRIFSSAPVAYITWHKFARYFDVEAPDHSDGNQILFTIDPGQILACIDENTICVGAVIGTTYTGACDPVKEINDVLIAVKGDRGWDIPLHVDAASGGFILPLPALK